MREKRERKGKGEDGERKERKRRERREEREDGEKKRRETDFFPIPQSLLFLFLFLSLSPSPSPSLSPSLSRWPRHRAIDSPRRPELFHFVSRAGARMRERERERGRGKKVEGERGREEGGGEEKVWLFVFDLSFLLYLFFSLLFSWPLSSLELLLLMPCSSPSHDQPSSSR